MFSTVYKMLDIKKVTIYFIFQQDVLKTTSSEEKIVNI